MYVYTYVLCSYHAYRHATSSATISANATIPTAPSAAVCTNVTVPPADVSAKPVPTVYDEPPAYSTVMQNQTVVGGSINYKREYL